MSTKKTISNHNRHPLTHQSHMVTVSKMLAPWAPVLILLIVSLFAMRALFHPGLFTSHDIWHQVARLYHFDQAIRDGQFPPRWSGLLLNGFGYPLFIFSYHLPWFIAEPFVLSGVSIADAIKIVFVTTFVLSGISMYFFLKEIWGKRAAFCGAFIYLFTPYRFVTILVRANIGEAVGFLFIPLAFWGLYRLYKQKTFSSILLTAFGICGFLLSHVMVVFLFAITGGLTFVIFLRNTLHKINFLIYAATAIIAGVGLAAYYLLPALYYKPQTVFQGMFETLYRSHFTEFKTLLYSPWGYGAIGTPGEMSRQVGIVIWFVVSLSFLYILFQVICNAQKIKTTSIQLAVVLLISFLSAIFLMQKISLPIWQLFEKQAFIDFPWRFLSVTTFIGSLLTAFMVSVMNRWLQKPFIIFLCLLALYTNRNHVRVNQYTDVPLSLYVASELTTNTDDEYLPQWVNRSYAKAEHPLVSGNTVQVQNGTVRTNTVVFNYTSLTPVEVQVNHMYFPGWIGLIDSQPAVVKKGNEGTIKLDLPEGPHMVKLVYAGTPVMHAGAGITFFSILFLILGTIYEHKKIKRGEL